MEFLETVSGVSFEGNPLKLNFVYEKDRDVWCLINYGASSNNSKTPTQVYEKLVTEYGDSPTEKQINDFVVEYLKDNAINVDEKLAKCESDWLSVRDNYQAKAEGIFGVILPKDITVFLTVNNRCPYNIENNSFFVTISSPIPNRIIMHELWHFYTWYKFGVIHEKIMGKQRYNDLKEALTVLLNIEFPDTFRRNPDIGYPQHQELRKQIEDIWNEEKDIEKLWNRLLETFC